MNQANQEETQNLLIWLERQGYAEATIKTTKIKLTQFLNWLERETLSNLNDLNMTHIENYNHYLQKRKTKKGTLLHPTTIKNHQELLKQIDKYQQKTQNNKPLIKHLIPPSKTKSNPITLTKEEIQNLYKATENTLLGYRDRAMLSLYYGCGLRRQEVENLEQKDINYSTKTLHITKSKTYRNRYIPMSNGVQKDILRYQKYSRPYLTIPKSDHLLLSQKTGKTLKGNSQLNRLKHLAQKANLATPITLHNLRHTIATHLLKDGMPLEKIRQFLGHQSLDSTQHYTQIYQGILML